ncbi:hypothetical protein U1Q18_017918 [Sarracenia purpurea var. burkii]
MLSPKSQKDPHPPDQLFMDIAEVKDSLLSLIRGFPLDHRSRRTVFAEVKCLDEEVNLAKVSSASRMSLETRINELKGLSSTTLMKGFNLSCDEDKAYVVEDRNTDVIVENGKMSDRKIISDLGSYESDEEDSEEIKDAEAEDGSKSEQGILQSPGTGHLEGLPKVAHQVFGEMGDDRMVVDKEDGGSDLVSDEDGTDSVFSEETCEKDDEVRTEEEEKGISDAALHDQVNVHAVNYDVSSDFAVENSENGDLVGRKVSALLNKQIGVNMGDSDCAHQVLDIKPKPAMHSVESHPVVVKPEQVGSVATEGLCDPQPGVGGFPKILKDLAEVQTGQTVEKSWANIVACDIHKTKHKAEFPRLNFRSGSKLEFFEPSSPGIIDIDEEMIDEHSWDLCLVGYFLDANLAFGLVRATAMSLWKNEGLFVTS